MVSMTSRHSRRSNFSMSLLVMTSLALGPLSTPAQARQGDVAKGAVAAIVIGCLLGLCDNNNKKAGSKRSKGTRSASPSDGASLEPAERVLIQTTLQRKGLYSGTVDGDFGPGTRSAIKAWQGSVSAKETGYLTGGQANAFVNVAAL